MRQSSPAPFTPAAEAAAQSNRTHKAPAAKNDSLLSRLEYLAELLADAPALPRSPVLLWREPGGTVQHKLIGARLVVGRQQGAADLALPNDKLLSRTHFEVRRDGDTCAVEDLSSRNGTSLNTPANRVRSRRLHDGDLILAGQQAFAFLDQRLTE